MNEKKTKDNKRPKYMDEQTEINISTKIKKSKSTLTMTTTTYILYNTEVAMLLKEQIQLIQNMIHHSDDES